MDGSPALNSGTTHASPVLGSGEHALQEQPRGKQARCVKPQRQIRAKRSGNQAVSSEDNPRRGMCDAMQDTSLPAVIAELDGPCAQPDAEQLAFHEEQRQWEARQTEWEERLLRRSEALDARIADFDARVAEFDRRCRQWEAQHLAAETPPMQIDAEPERQGLGERHSDAPVDASEILRQVRAMNVLAEKAAAPDEVEPQPREAELGSGATRSLSDTTASPSVEEGEELLDCIDQLLARLCGTETAGISAGHPPVAVSRTRPSMTQPTEPKPAEQVAQPAAAGIMPTRAAIRETQVQIRALRELANASARSAIVRHTRRKMLLATCDNLLVAVVGLLSGAAMLWFHRSPGTSDVTCCAAVAGLVVAVLWGTRFANAVQELIADRLGWRK